MTGRLKMTEEAFQTQVIDLARLFGWLVHHARPARTAKGWRTPIQGNKGFPDLVLARAGVVIFAELKSETGRQTLDQKLWEQELPTTVDLRSFGGYVLWRPNNIRTIEETLR